MKYCDSTSPIQSLWIGPDLSIMEQLCIKSFLANGHAFHLYVYEEVTGVPNGTILLDADQIVTKDNIFKYSKYNSYAGFANLFRYSLLTQKGGYWVDTDIICLRQFPHKEDYLFAGQYYENGSNSDQKSVPANNCVIKAPAGADIVNYCYNISATKDNKVLRWGETGPRLLSKAIKLFNMSNYIADPADFCPLPWWKWDRLIKNDQSSITEFSIGTKPYSIHLWNERWRRADLNKNAKYPKNSIYEILKRRYL